MYKLHNIFDRQEDIVTIYRCFEDLISKKFYVQSKDSFYTPIDIDQLNSSNMHLIELFVDQEPRNRDKGYDNLQAAIENFEKDFSN